MQLGYESPRLFTVAVTIDVYGVVWPMAPHTLRPLQIYGSSPCEF
jgi:hypothetical protein